MSDPRLVRRLDAVTSRLRRLRRLRTFTAGWLAAAAVCLVLALTGSIRGSLGLALLMPIVVLVCGAWWMRRRDSDGYRAALLVEQRFPELDSALLTALQQQPERPGGTYGYLQERVVSEAVAHARRCPWLDAVPARSLRNWQAAHAAALLVFVAAAAWMAQSHGGADDSAMASDGGALRDGRESTVRVEPGDVELERGRSLVVTAEFSGPVPTRVDLVVVKEAQQEQWIPLSRSLSDPVYGGRIPEVRSDLSYRVEYEGGRSEEYRVRTFEFPALLQADATIVGPEYTGLGERQIKDTRSVSLVEGSVLTLTCRFNKPLESAVLESETGERLALGPFASADETQDDLDDVLGGVTWQPRQSLRWQLLGADEAGRPLREPVQFQIDVIPNRPPELAVTFPSRDVQVSALEELPLEATAWDDHGLREFGLVYRTPSGEERTLVLGAEAPRQTEIPLSHLLALEDLQPEARDLLSYSFYADDLDAQGRVRRTFSDVFFAEVRHFDEEYRQMPGQAQGQGSAGAGAAAGNPTQQLVELQRQIVIAVWNAIRAWTSEESRRHTDDYRERVGVMADSQLEARGMAERLAAQIEDPAAQEHAAAAQQHMTAAHEQLSLARTDGSVEPLPAARDESQRAYQALLRLQDRLHVVQQQEGGAAGGGGGGQGLDRRLEQLELRNDRNRYESERQAQAAQEAQQREQLQVLNRLRELSRRQEDLNERLKELDDRLRLAASEQEREEIERELKRLRDEQQQLLRDADELRDRMQRPENQRQMAEARDQLERTRSDLQRATEALQSGQTSRALTAGTRAQQQLERMREEFRRRTAGAFDDAVRTLQQDARQLADRQRALGDELNSPAPSGQDGPPSLRDNDQRTRLASELLEQQERLQALVEQMRQLVEQSEQSEPLLSKHLYDAIRDSRADQPEEALRIAEQLLRRGFPAEGAAAESQARRGIERLEQGVDRAAESILGDELQSLQRARDQLAQLTQGIENELDAAARRASNEGGSAMESDRPVSPAEATDTDPAGSGGQTRDARGSRASPGERQEEAEQPGADPAQSDPSSPGDAGRESESERSASPAAGQQQQRGGQNSEAAGANSGRGDRPPSDRSGAQGGQEPAEGRGSAGNPAGGSLTDLFNTGGASEGGGTAGGRPLTGEDFTSWSDAMRDVEEMLSLPELRAQAAAVRERARDVRREYKRHSKAPDWEMVRTEIYGPLLEMQTRLNEEIAQRQPQDEIVPIDRDPVPEKYADLVRRYYERLSRSRPAGE